MTKLEKRMVNFIFNIIDQDRVRNEVYQYQNTIYWKCGGLIKKGIILNVIKNKKILYLKDKRVRDSKVRNTYTYSKETKSLFKEYMKLKPKLKVEQILKNWK